MPWPSRAFTDTLLPPCAAEEMPLGGELGDVTNKLSALNVDGADAAKPQACAPQWPRPDGTGQRS